MTHLLSRLTAWFESYVDEFQSHDPDVRKNIQLKRAHTCRVRGAILEIGASLDLTGNELMLAESCALLHDVGRFEQYSRYRTFSDSKSEDHAALGVRIIQQQGILDGVDPSVSDIIIRAVKDHNKAEIAADDGSWVLYLKLLRDADKIDIWQVVTDYYRNFSPNPAIELDLPDVDTISDSIYNSLINKGLALMQDLRTLNDFKVMQMGWVYDLNFPRSFQIVKERQYLEKIRSALPDSSERAREIYDRAAAYVASRLPAD